jgi:hypothetical protein
VLLLLLRLLLLMLLLFGTYWLSSQLRQVKMFHLTSLSLSLFLSRSSFLTNDYAQHHPGLSLSYFDSGFFITSHWKNYWERRHQLIRWGWIVAVLISAFLYISSITICIIYGERRQRER